MGGEGHCHPLGSMYLAKDTDDLSCRETLFRIPYCHRQAVVSVYRECTVIVVSEASVLERWGVRDVRKCVGASVLTLDGQPITMLRERVPCVVFERLDKEACSGCISDDPKLSAVADP